MKKIILCRADLKEYVIAKRDFKYLYPSDFEDLYLLNLQGHLNHLSPDDKKVLTTAVNLWTRNLVIRQRVEDFQLGIESYQTQLNLTKPRWDATGFEFKHDYTVIDSPREVTFKDRYGVQMIMRFNEIYKFSEGTLQQIDEALDYRVKEFRVNRTNPGMNTRFWTKKDVVRSKEFMFAIQKRLKTRRIFRNLESFVGGRIREGDYRSYKDGKVRYSFPRSRQNRRDLPRDNPLVSVEVLSLPLEWSKFVTDVKLVKDLHTTNFDQLHAYLEQHEFHANEVRLMREHSQDPLALFANHQITPSHFNTYQSSYNNYQFQQQQQFSPSQSPQYGSNHSTQHYSTTYPSTPHAITYPSAPYPNAYSSTVHQEACPQPQSVPQIEYTISTVNQQTHLAEFPQIDSSLIVPVFKQGDDPIDAINKMMNKSYYFKNIRELFRSTKGCEVFLTCQRKVIIARQCPKPKSKRDAMWFREKVLLVEAQGNGKVLNEEELEFLADPGIVEGPVT
ncbi:hypothetical protein Tco_0894792 [Tanacetum coccineum]|uniref:Uncharacterized protein n=1 Tax=Tanacetum coccineum TaxID=301880 RepID=A0ABQ5CCS9_9ASTR